MRYYYKDNKGSLFNFKSEHFVKYKEVSETVTITDEAGNPLFDGKGEHFTQTVTKKVPDGLQDGYTQITEEEFNELTKPKVYVPTAAQKAAYEKAKKIAEYKKYLQDTDYIVLKIGECLADGNTEEVTAIKTEYAEHLAKRKEARNKINELEK